MKTLLLSCQWALVISLIGPAKYAQAQISFSIDKDPVATEPAKGSTTYVLRIKANATLTTPMQVTVTDQLTGDASPTQDYSFRPNPAIMTFGPGLQQTQLIGIEIYADSKIEENETIHLKLSVPTGYTVSTADSYTVNITDANQETPPLSPFRIATGSNFDF